MKNVYLISSHEDPKSGLRKNKMPGLQLIKEILKEFNCNYLYIPATYSMFESKHNINRYILFIYRYIKSSLKLLGLVLFKKELKIVFYNLPKAYLPIYFLSLLRGRPRLILADGLNCFGLEKISFKFFLFFKKIISLPITDKTRFSYFKSKTIWMPGLVSKDLDSLADNNRVYMDKYLLYNSAPFIHNGAMDLIEVARELKIDILITEAREDFERITDRRVDSYPDNLKFFGRQSWSDYLSLINNAEGILLIRDENIFANRYNFPSKVIEALALGVPIYSLHTISGLDDSLYIDLSSAKYSEISLTESRDIYLKEFSLSHKKEFLMSCNLPSRSDFFN